MSLSIQPKLADTSTARAPSKDPPKYLNTSASTQRGGFRGRGRGGSMAPTRGRGVRRGGLFAHALPTTTTATTSLRAADDIAPKSANLSSSFPQVDPSKVEEKKYIQADSKHSTSSLSAGLPTKPLKSQSRSPSRKRSPPTVTISASAPSTPLPQSSGSNPHPRSRRGRRLKNKEGIEVPKPLTLEEAFASIKCNPFGGPLNSPGLDFPLGRSTPSPATPAFSASRRESTTPPSPDIGTSQEAHNKDAEPQEENDLTAETTITLTVPAGDGPVSRPHTPSTHFDWAGDEDDGSLPDLDDWVTGPAKTDDIPPPVEEPSIPQIELPVETTERTAETSAIEEKEGLSSGTVKEASAEIKADPANVRDAATTVEHDKPTLAEVAGSHPVEQGSENVRVALPGATRLPALVPNRSTGTANEPARWLRPAVSDANLNSHTRPFPQTPPHQRPSSVLSSPTPPPRSVLPPNNAAQSDRFHTRTRSLPHNGRGGVHSRPHTTRPVLSAAGLTRISRTLAQSGLVAAPTESKARTSGAAVTD